MIRHGSQSLMQLKSAVSSSVFNSKNLLNHNPLSCFISLRSVFLPKLSLKLQSSSSTSGLRSISSMSSSFKPEQAKVPSALPLPAPPLTKFNIGLCQLSVTTDKKRNISHAKNAIEEAASKGAKIVLLPVYAEDIDAGGDASPSIAMLSEVSKRLKITIIGGSIPEIFGDLLYNYCCVFGSDGELKAKHRKIHLFDIDIPGKITFMESRTLTAGETPTIVDTDVGRIGIGICYDIRFQELAMIYAARGAHLLCYPGAFNMTTGPLHWELLQRARATDSQLYVATCSPARDSGAGYTAWGHTTLVGPIHLFDIDIPGKITFMESKTLTAGETPTIVDTDVERIGIGICYDIRFQELAMIYAARGKAMAKYLTLFSAMHLVAPEIPLDLQMEILKRLPSKSLMRFKCVSKLWSCLIRSRYFSKLYRTAAIPPRQPCVYMSLVEHEDCDSMEVCQNPGKYILLALSSSSSSSSSSNSAESLEPFFTIEGIGGEDMVILRGLILYTVCRRACIYNPTTRQSVTLPAVKSIIFAQEFHDKYVYYFLGHDPVLDQYKVVCIVVTSPEEEESDNLMTSEHWVLVLEAGSSWKKIEFDQPPAHASTSAGLCINGVIYYLACTRTSWEIVMSFDVRSEEFKMIQAPQLGDSVGFIEYDGKPTIFDHTYIRQNGLVDLWVMEDDGGKWSKKSLVLQPSQMHLVEDDSIKEFTVKCTSQKGEIILVPKPYPSPSYFLYYDIQKNDLRKVNISGLSGHYGLRFSFRHMDQNESIMYLEI